MNTCESRQHYLKYYKMYMLNQHTNLSVILEWQRQLQMVSHKNYNLNVNEDFVIFLTSKLSTCFINGFASGMKSHSISYLLIGSAHIYWILDLAGEVDSIWDLKPSDLQECKGNIFIEVGRGGQQFSVEFKKIPRGLPQPGSDTPETSWGVLTVRPHGGPLPLKSLCTHPPMFWSMLKLCKIIAPSASIQHPPSPCLEPPSCQQPTPIHHKTITWNMKFLNQARTGLCHFWIPLYLGGFDRNLYCCT